MSRKSPNVSLPVRALLAAGLACAAGVAFAQDDPQTSYPQTQPTPPTPPVPTVPPTPPTPPVPPTPEQPMPPTPPPPPPAPDAPMPPEPPMPPPPGAPMPPEAPMPPSGTTPPTGAPVTVREQQPDSISSNYKVDFGALDKNGDGNVSRSEVRASGNEDLMREFHVVDANHNGRLTQDEMKGWLD